MGRLLRYDEDDINALTQGCDALRAENERLRVAILEIIKVSNKYKLKEDQRDDDYWGGDIYDVLTEIDKILDKALNEETK